MSTTRCILAVVISLSGTVVCTQDVQAMGLEQFRKLAGARLLDTRIDTVFRQCGLPAMIVDTGDVTQQGRMVRWGKTRMRLTPMKWEIRYARQPDPGTIQNSWINPNATSHSCLPGLSQLILHAKGGVGDLSVKKRPDNKGYVTSYRVSENLFSAHQVSGFTATWTQGMPITRIQDQFGKPDEILKGESGITTSRYWVVVRDKQMPVAVYAIDFEMKDRDNICTRYTVYTSDTEFVQVKFDAVAREWERVYVLD
jgi:hypothetical protein